MQLVKEGLHTLQPFVQRSYLFQGPGNHSEESFTYSWTSGKFMDNFDEGLPNQVAS